MRAGTVIAGRRWLPGNASDALMNVVVKACVVWRSLFVQLRLSFNST